MVAPLNLEEGQSSTRPPRFNVQFYSWWRKSMHDCLMAEDSELWDIVLDGPFIPTTEYNEADRKKIEKSYRAKKLLVCGIGADEYNYIYACESAKEIWDCLRTAHEGTEQVKESKVDMLTTKYENFTMKERETIHEMYTRFSSITNELRCLGEPIHSSKQVRKILRVLPTSWASKVDAITKAKDLKVLTMDTLIGNIQTREMNRNQDPSRKEVKKDRSLALKISQSDVSSEEEDMAYLSKRFQKIVGYFIRDCLMLKAETREHQRSGGKNDRRRDLVPEKNARKPAVEYVVNKALIVWGDSSSESEESECPDDASMMVVKDDENVFDGLFALMAKSDSEEDKQKVTLLDLKQNLNTYFVRMLRNVADVLIDSVIKLTAEKDSMNNSLDKFSEEKTALTIHMSVIEEQLTVLDIENLELKEQLGIMNEKSGK
ncbi:uncharacterized protein LOC125837822 [Solanum verrucosum]|uniref:uncharacterized protein LOC125837822 n=1 Tax=Solanum verrucosum TaxID=315347 RepID=UPI0020D07A25|nr:uncharacterized protein LOC125837822 [Solanum verrucosum]